MNFSMKTRSSPKLDLASDHRVRLWRLPERFANANLNTGVFDERGVYWFTGQNGIYGRFDPRPGHCLVDRQTVARRNRLGRIHELLALLGHRRVNRTGR